MPFAGGSGVSPENPSFLFSLPQALPYEPAERKLDALASLQARISR